MVAEHGEHAHHCHLVPRDAVARTGGVAGHQHAGNHADVVEDPGQPLAHASRVPARHRGHVPHVRVRERGDQAVHLDVAPADRGDGLAEIDPHDAGAPVGLEIAVAVGPMLLAPPLHVAPHRRVRALEALPSTSLAYTRLAVWRCLRGMSLSANSHESTVPGYASIRERRPFPAAGFESLRDTDPKGQLYRAWQLKELLRTLLKHPIGQATTELNRWGFRASHSRIPEIVELAKKIRRRRPDILRTIRLGYSNARLEAFNNRIKVTIRMAYGFHHVTNLIALVMLRCGGLDIRLPQPAI